MTREELISQYEAELDRMTEEQKDAVMFSCECGEHELSYRSLVKAMKDPNNQDGQAFIQTALSLHEANSQHD